MNEKGIFCIKKEETLQELKDVDFENYKIAEDTTQHYEERIKKIENENNLLKDKIKMVLKED